MGIYPAQPLAIQLLSLQKKHHLIVFRHGNQGQRLQ